LKLFFLNFLFENSNVSSQAQKSRAMVRVSHETQRWQILSNDEYFYIELPVGMTKLKHEGAILVFLPQNTPKYSWKIHFQLNKLFDATCLSTIPLKLAFKFSFDDKPNIDHVTLNETSHILHLELNKNCVSIIFYCLGYKIQEIVQENVPFFEVLTIDNVDNVSHLNFRPKSKNMGDFDWNMVKKS